MKNNIKHPWLAVYIAIALLVYLPLFFFLLNIRHKQLQEGVPERLAYPVAERDQIGFVDIADNIIQHGTFSEQLSAPFTPGTFRTPGLPSLLVVWKIIFRSYTAFPLFQIILATLTAFLIFRIGKTIYSSKVGGVAGLLFLIDPNTVFHTLVIQADILNAFLIVLIAYFFCTSPRRSTKIAALLFGFLIGFSTLTRPISMFLIALFIPFYCYFEWKMDAKKLALNIFIFICGFSLLVVPWAVRNKVQTGVFGISSVKDYNFFQYYIPSYMAYKQHISISDAKNILFKEIAPIKDSETYGLEVSPQLHTAWMKHFKQDPIGYGMFHIFKTIPVFLSSGTKTFFDGFGSMMGAPSLITSQANMTDLLIHVKVREFAKEIIKSPFVMIEEIALLLLCVFAAIALCFKKNRACTILFVGIVLYFSLLTGTVAYSRFRLPISPFLFLLAVFAVGEIWRVIRKKIKTT